MSSWTPTNHLRWYWPRVTLETVNVQTKAHGAPPIPKEQWDAAVLLDPSMEYPEGHLQQLWLNEKGEEEWRTPPEIMEGQAPAPKESDDHH